MLKGFRQFIFRGNVVDLAVAVVIGAAFGAVVTAFVKDLLTPLIAAIAGKPDFSALRLTLNKSEFLYGDLYQRDHLVPAGGCGCVLLRSGADECIDGAPEARRSTARPNNEAVP